MLHQKTEFCLGYMFLKFSKVESYVSYKTELKSTLKSLLGLETKISATNKQLIHTVIKFSVLEWPVKEGPEQSGLYLLKLRCIAAKFYIRSFSSSLQASLGHFQWILLCLDGSLQQHDCILCLEDLLEYLNKADRFVSLTCMQNWNLLPLLDTPIGTASVLGCHLA